MKQALKGMKSGGEAYNEDIGGDGARGGNLESGMDVDAIER